MGQLLGAQQSAALPEVLDDRLAGVGGVLAVQPAVRLVERAGVVDRHEHGQAQVAAEVEVLLAAAGRDVDDAGALVGADHVPRDDPVLDALLRGQVVERADVRPPDQLGALRPLDDAGRLAEHGLDAALHHPGQTRAAGDRDVVGLGVDGGGDVGRQRPGRRRPHHDRLVGGVGQRQVDVQRRMREVAVAVGGGQLVLRQRRAAARAPDHRPVSRVQPALVGAALQEQPDVLDVGVGHREVRPVPVHPHAEPLRLPGLDAAYSATRSRQAVMNLSRPYASISRLELSPSAFSTSTSTHRPWQSNPFWYRWSRPRIAW